MEMQTFKVVADLAKAESELEPEECIEKLREILDTAKVMMEPETEGFRVEFFREGNVGAESHLRALEEAVGHAQMKCGALQVTVMPA